MSFDAVHTFVGANLRRLRRMRGYSLERLALASGVSRAMIGQIELGKSNPTVNILFKITRTLGVTFAALVDARRKASAQILRAGEAPTTTIGGVRARQLFPPGESPRAELYELVLSAGASETACACAAGTVENLTVALGSIDVTTDGRTHLLHRGDALVVEADAPRVYLNRDTSEALLYVVRTRASLDDR